MRNVINLFPPEIRAEVDAMIQSQASASSIHRMFHDKYASVITPPSLPTVLKYVRIRHEELKRVNLSAISPSSVSQFALGLSELAKVADQARNKNEPNFSKIRVLEGLVGKCALRIQAIEEVTSNRTTIVPGLEQAMVKYIGEIKGIIESVIKLSTDLRKDDEEILQLIHAESQAFLKIVKAVVLDVCPEKYDLFKLRLKEGLKIKSIELAVDEENKYEKKNPTDAEIISAVGALPEMVSIPTAFGTVEHKPEDFIIPTETPAAQLQIQYTETPAAQLQIQYTETPAAQPQIQYTEKEPEQSQIQDSAAADAEVKKHVEAVEQLAVTESSAEAVADKVIETLAEGDESAESI